MRDRWLQRATLAAVGLLSLAACFRRIWAVDFWWQNRTGRYVLEHGWPAVDIFSYTVPGEPWIELRWLFCVVQYAVGESLGIAALLTLKWLAIAVAFVAVTLPVSGRRISASIAPVVLVALMTTSQRFLVRPELVTFAFFGLFVYVLHRYRSTGTRWVLALPLLQIVWVNSHTLFVFGPLLVGLLLVVTSIGIRLPSFRSGDGLQAVGQTRTLAVLLVATTLACLLNPYTWQGALFPFRLFAEIRGESLFNQFIEEFQSPFRFGLALTATRYYVASIALVALSAGLNWRRLDPYWTILCLSQLYLSALAVRNLPLFALSAVPFVLSNLRRSSVVAAIPPRAATLAARAAAAVTIAFCGWYSVELLTDRSSLRQDISTQSGIGLAEHRYPIEALRFLDDAGLRGRIFAEIGDGSYLLAHERRVFIDPRLEVYGESWLRRYLAVLQDPSAFRGTVQELQIGVLVVSLQSNLTRQASLDSHWALVHFDAVSAVFVRRDLLGGLDPIDSPAEFTSALGRLRAELPPPRAYDDLGPFERVTLPGPYLAVADFLLMYSRPADAADYLDDALRASPFVRDTALRRATVEELSGNWEAVVAAAEAGLEESSDDPRLQVKLALGLEKLGRIDEARLWLERSLVAWPERARSWGRLGAIHARRNDFAEAERALRRAVELAPDDASYIANLARVRAGLNRPLEAIEGLEKARRLAPNDVTVLRDLALLHRESGDPALARRYLELGLRLAPDDAALGALRDAFAYP